MGAAHGRFEKVFAAVTLYGSGAARGHGPGATGIGARSCARCEADRVPGCGQRRAEGLAECGFFQTVLIARTICVVGR